MIGARLLVRALRDPASIGEFDWAGLVSAARAEPDSEAGRSAAAALAANGGLDTPPPAATGQPPRLPPPELPK